MKEFYKKIEEVCETLERQWQKYNYAAEDFYKVVWEHTEDLDLSPLKDVSSQMDLLQASSAVRKNQHLSTFSDLHFQIYHNGRFMIEILNWAGSHVNVHDHDFSGVQFQLKGESLNVVYDFSPREQMGAVKFGELSVRRAELWAEGSRSIVRHGDLDPHGVFHLSMPTTSLLIRTTPTPRLGFQSNYFPDLAANYYVNTEIQRKKLTALNLLAKQSPKDFVRLLGSFLNSQSLSENLFMLVKLGETAFNDESAATIGEYADRGEHESRVVRSAIVNNGIDFFKAAATLRSGITEEERLAASMVAGAHCPRNFEVVMNDLSQRGCKLDFKKNFQSFVSKMSASEQEEANRYLQIFELQGYVNA